MATIEAIEVDTPEGQTVIVRWFDREQRMAPIDLIVWPGGGFAKTLAGFRVAATHETLRLFEAGQA